MNELREQEISCPYCGETIRILLEGTDVAQEYIEDCQVCCRPINFYLSIEVEGDVTLRVAHEDDAY